MMALALALDLVSMVQVEEQGSSHSDLCQPTKPTMRSWYVLWWLAQENKPHIGSWTCMETTAWHRRLLAFLQVPCWLLPSLLPHNFRMCLSYATIFFPQWSAARRFYCVLSSRAARRHVGILFFTDHDFDSAMNFKSLYLLGWKHFALMCFILWYMQSITKRSYVVKTWI